MGSLCKPFGPVSTCLCPNYIKFCFQNSGNSREDKKKRIDRLLLALIMKNKFPIYILLKLNFFSFSKSKVVCESPFLSSLVLPKFWMNKICKFAKYHMPLIDQSL